jgi:hypothetical protein
MYKSAEASLVTPPAPEVRLEGAVIDGGKPKV